MIKTIKSIIGIIILTGFLSCVSEKEKGLNNLLGDWNSEWSGKDYVLSFTKVDTMITGILKNVPSESRYSTDQVLFKDIKFLNDTTVICKGLYMKEVFNKYVVKKPTIFNWGGDDGHGNVFVEEKVFDHYENLYVDYRLELKSNKTELVCKGFSEGAEWIFCRPLTAEEKLIKSKHVEEEKRKADSISKYNRLYFSDGTPRERTFLPPIKLNINVYIRQSMKIYEKTNEIVTLHVKKIHYKIGKVFSIVDFEEPGAGKLYLWNGKSTIDWRFELHPEEMNDSIRVFDAIKVFLGKFR